MIGGKSTREGGNAMGWLFLFALIFLTIGIACLASNKPKVVVVVPET